MARLSLSRNAERRKRLVVVLTVWLEMCSAVSWFLSLLSSEASLYSCRPRDEYGVEHDSHDIDESFTQSQTSTVERQVENISAKKKKKNNDMGEPSHVDSIIIAARLLSDSIKEVGKELCKNIGTEMIIQQRIQELHGALGEIEGLTDDEKDTALSKISDHPAQILVFFSLVPTRKFGWVRKFLATH